MNKDQIAVSLMCMDFLKIKEQLEELNESVGMYHIDIMDGHFCKNITLSPDLIKSFKKVSKLPMDVHLMTTEPNDWIETVAEAGADIISVHAETINGDAYRIYNEIERLGCKRGLVLNPATTLESVKHYLNRVDLLTIMTVDVGFSGQPFIEEMLDKIAEAKKLREENGYHYKIQIDGSCNPKTFKRLKEAGAERVCGMDDILTAPVNGSGCNEKYGLLGSNKSTEDTIKLFPRECSDLVYEIQKQILDRTGKHVEVMVYGDGAFKDPVGKIWELADPVVAVANTEGLEGTPNEIKLKYLADNDFKDLSGAALKDAISQRIREKKSDLVGDMASQGTTPRKLTDLIGSLCDLTSGSGDKGTPIILVQGYFDNYTN